MKPGGVSKILFCVVLLLASCGGGGGRIAVRSVEPVDVVRFDSLLLQYAGCDDTLRRADIVAECGDFWHIYNRRILGFRETPFYVAELQAFVNDTAIAGLYADVLREYADMSTECEALSSLAARYKVLFPDAAMPVFQTHVSGLHRSIVTLDSLISISLDCYLGADYRLYKQRYNVYERPLHVRERIVADVAEVLLRNALPEGEVSTLLDAMIYEGRIACLMSALIDDDRAEAVLGYTPDEALWCSEHEARIWASIVEQSHLFATDNMTIRKYIQPAPFTATLTQDAPGRVGRWVGWRIVKAYAECENLTPQELVTDRRTATEVLRLSGYMGK